MKELSFLKDLGLTDNDIQLYGTLIELGPSYLSSITNKAGINRTSAYYMLEKLMKMGLVKLDARVSKRKYYLAEEPSVLLTLYDDYLENKQKVKQDIKKTVKELDRVYNDQHSAPHVSFLNQVQGIKKAVQDAYSGKYSDIRKIQISGELEKLVGESWVSQMYTTQSQNNIRVKTLLSESKANRNYMSHNETYRILPKTVSPHITYWLYGDKIAYFSSELEGYAMIIESKDLSHTQREIFDYLWGVSTPFDPNLKDI